MGRKRRSKTDGKEAAEGELPIDGLGPVIKRLRKIIGLTQKEFGPLVGVTGASLAEFESGRAKVSNFLWHRISDYTGALVLVRDEKPDAVLCEHIVPRMSQQGPYTRESFEQWRKWTFVRDMLKDPLLELNRAIMLQVQSQWLEQGTVPQLAEDLALLHQNGLIITPGGQVEIKISPSEDHWVSWQNYLEGLSAPVASDQLEEVRSQVELVSRLGHKTAAMEKVRRLIADLTTATKPQQQPG